ncbi:MAG: MarR family transcriptional regulator [Pseudomonadota bacterium]|nr:MarR family transcriptional regulator [Pseudomonadota bacterium]
MSPVHERPPDPEHIAEAAVTLGQLWRANHELELLSKRMIKSLGVTGPQRMVLRIIARKRGISASGICETARIHASTLTGILERLARGGFIERTRDSDDGRRARFDLTPAGTRIAEARRGTVESAIVTSLASLSPEERAVVRRWLSAFGDALGQERALGDDEVRAS